MRGTSNGVWTYSYTTAMWRQILTLFLVAVVLRERSVVGQTLVDNSAPTPQTRNFECRPNGCCDHHEWCRFWASIGECEGNNFWMADNCQLACNTCSRPPVPTTVETPGVTTVGSPSATQTEPEARPPQTRRITVPTRRPTESAGSSTQRCAQIGRNVSPDLPIILNREQLVVDTELSHFRRLLNVDDVARSNNQFGCVPRLPNTDCMPNLCYHMSFRTMDGSCNNIRSPVFGAAFTPLKRLKPAVYDDGIEAPVGAIKLNRPSPREASRFLLSSGEVVNNRNYSSMLMQWGQFVSHDVAKTTLLPSSPCTSCVDVQGRCFNIVTMPGDPRFGQQGCLRSARSSPVCGTGEKSPRQQLNENTAFIDGSMVYGSSLADMQKIREPDGSGMLRISRFNNQIFMPFNQNQCFGPNSCNANFQAGDNRANIFLGLTVLHTLFVREHNRLVQELKRVNPGWSGERLFQEARKIVGAQLQAITYKEYLPKILGSATPTVLGNYTDYDPEMDPSISNEFTTSAFRFGHGMIHEFLPRLNGNGQMIPQGGLNFADGVFRSNKLLFGGGIDPVIRGLLTTPAKRPQRLGPAITENLFGGTDLAALNIQRGRDHGLPSYTAWRDFCGLTKGKTFDDFKAEMLDDNVRANLKQGYRETDKVDLYVGSMLEDPVMDGMVGTTLSCLIGEQFKRLRTADRFYYENVGVFTPAQMHELSKVTLSGVICANSDSMRLIPADAFELAVGANLATCSTLPQMDVTKWQQ